MEEDRAARYKYIRFKPSEKYNWVSCCLYRVLDRTKPPWERVENTLTLTESGHKMAEMIDQALREDRVEVQCNHIWIEQDYCTDDMWDSESEYAFRV